MGDNCNYRIARNFEALIFRGLASKSHFVAQCSRNDCLPEATPLNLARYSMQVRNDFRGLNFRVGLLTHEIHEN